MEAFDIFWEKNIENSQEEENARDENVSCFKIFARKKKGMFLEI